MNTSDQIQNIRQITNALADLKVHLASNVGSLSTPEAVALGQSLWALTRRATEVVEPIKERLRSEAFLAASSTTGSHRIDGLDGMSCNVVFAPANFQLRSDANMADLHTTLGGLFSELFDEKITYKPRSNFAAAVKRVPADALAPLLAAVEMKENAAKVYFTD